MEKQRETFAQRARWLFENHVEFLATHRGAVTRYPDAFAVESDRPEFTYAVLGRGGSRELLDRFNTVHLIPWSEPWDQEPNDPRFQRKASLSYMSFDGDPKVWIKEKNVEVCRVASASDMDTFSHVQAAGFAQSQADYDRWHPWLKAANHRNLSNPHQAFYVGFFDGKPVGTTLLVETQGLAGIYAVATLPDYRKRGVGSSLMAQAIAEATQRGTQTITLQVVEGSYAESLYKKLGFKTDFSARIFSR
jgi:ribosomal protein S18 acetylase RimI-like enzyme